MGPAGGLREWLEGVVGGLGAWLGGVVDELRGLALAWLAVGLGRGPYAL